MTFPVPHNLIGIIIGKQGSNITNIKKKYGIQVIIDDGEAEEPSTVRLYGEDMTTLGQV